MGTPVVGTFETYTVKGDREDLSDVIYNIDPIDCPVMSSIGRGTATNVSHEWQTDQLEAAAYNAQVEASETTFAVVTPTIRPTNICQISDKSVVISGTNEAVDKAGRGSEMAYQLARKSKSLKRDMEYTITRDQDGAAGASDVARKLWSMENWLGPAPVGGSVTSSRGAGAGADPVFTAGTPSTGVVDGTARPLLESYFKAVLQACWTNGGDASLIVTGPFNKATISSFSGNSTRFDKGEDKTLVSAIDIYVSDYGTHRIVADRFSRDRSVLCLDPSLWSIDYLRPFMQTPLAKTGDAEKRLLNVEYTLRASNHFGSGIVADLTVV
jgi:hypothetical protein